MAGAEPNGEDVTDTAAPLVVIVLGRSATGKTTLVRRITEQVPLPLLAKDDLKEILFDSLGTGGRDRSRALGRATFPLLDYAIERLLESGSSFIIEAAYTAAYEDEKFQAWQRAFGFRALQIHCSAGPEVLIRRYQERAASGLRHPGHADAESVDEFRGSLSDGRSETLSIEGEVLEFDSTVPGATEWVIERLRTELAASGGRARHHSE